MTDRWRWPKLPPRLGRASRRWLAPSSTSPPSRLPRGPTAPPRAAPAAALRYLADPTDLAAARRVLARVRSAEGRFPTAQAGKLSHNLSPFGSVAALEAQLCWAATVLELPTAVDGEGVAGGVGKAAGDDAIADAV
eukprot:TRINITY_DN2032_c0_g1_i2.p2 TRINITY_DN2032_c0_g1~~TRINITY_DN2032_c0_g1_i2.p2  ORF type:complete len:136 (+),score=24.00 TRINITY_DN2032_c0_g1_i2:304-711(+)